MLLWFSTTPKNIWQVLCNMIMYLTTFYCAWCTEVSTGSYISVGFESYNSTCLMSQLWLKTGGSYTSPTKRFERQLGVSQTSKYNDSLNTFILVDMLHSTGDDTLSILKFTVEFGWSFFNPIVTVIADDSLKTKLKSNLCIFLFYLRTNLTLQHFKPLHTDYCSQSLCK